MLFIQPTQRLPPNNNTLGGASDYTQIRMKSADFLILFYLNIMRCLQSCTLRKMERMAPVPNFNDLLPVAETSPTYYDFHIHRPLFHGHS